MSRIAAISLMPATPARAHNGLNLHPHGIDLGWVTPAPVALIAGLVLALVRRPK